MTRAEEHATKELNRTTTKRSLLGCPPSCSSDLCILPFLRHILELPTAPRTPYIPNRLLTISGSGAFTVVVARLQCSNLSDVMVCGKPVTRGGAQRRLA
jgi:hypothetical protein